MKGLSTIGQRNLKYSYYSRNLPHLFDDHSPVFITYRLKFTLPESIVKELNRRKADWNTDFQSLAEEAKQDKIKKKRETMFQWFDELITQSTEVPQILHRRDLTKIIANAFHYLDDKYYQLLAYCIMPNHIHVLIYPITQPNGDIFSPAHITYSWKRYTANQINKILHTRGSVWQQESYDHLVRNDKEMTHILEYIIDNPVEAGLAVQWYEWPGTWIRDDLKPSQ